tara:strand:+ start:489 stop:869 length:381 start_codon:yes stop_codon:yes gene_type:complete
MGKEILINQILLILSSIFIIEYIFYLRLISKINNNLQIYKKILNLIRNKKIDDDEKKSKIFIYIKNLLYSSLIIFLIIILIVFFLLLLQLISKTFINFYFSGIGIIEVFLFLIIYYVLRKKFNAKL